MEHKNLALLKRKYSFLINFAWIIASILVNVLFLYYIKTEFQNQKQVLVETKAAIDKKYYSPYLIKADNRVYVFERATMQLYNTEIFRESYIYDNPKDSAAVTNFVKYIQETIKK